MSDNYVFERGVDDEGNVIEVVGTPLYRKGRTGFADSVSAAQEAGLQRAPTYMFALARATAEKTDPTWSKWNDTNAEVDTMLDEDGILGEAGKLYVVDFQRGGIFVNDPNRVHDTITEGRLQNGAMPLDQDEVNEFLTYVRDGDVAALVQKGWLQGPDGDNYIFNDVGEFTEASNVDGFLRNTPGYVVITPSEAAQAESRGYKAISEQMNNPRLQIRSGGKEPLKGMLERAQSFGWTQFGSHSDGYGNKNSGRAVVLGDNEFGVGGKYNLDYLGRSIGVAPEALEARARIVGPVPSEVNPAKSAADLGVESTHPSLEQVLVFSRPFVSEHGLQDFEEGLRKLYE